MANIWDKPFTDQSTNQSQAPNPYYQSGSTYGADVDYNTSPISGAIREQNPQLAYAQYGNNIGLTNQDSQFQQWYYNQYPEFQRGYGLATMANPYLTIDDYTATLPNLAALMQRYQMESPDRRGIRDANFAPVARWITR